MASYVITCCSTVDLSKEHLKEKNIEYIPFHYYLDQTAYDDDLFTSLSPSDFYKALTDGAEPKTAQVNVDEFLARFTPILESGKDLIHLSLSSGLSGVFNSANVAANMLSGKYPDRKIYVVDTLGASSGFGLIADKAAELRDGGMTIDELYAWLEAHKKEMHHWFFSTDLTFFIKGGRVSPLSGWFGTVLKICPLLDMDKDGHLVPRFKIRGKARVRQEIVNKMKQFAHDRENYSGKCFLSHSDCYEDARAVADLVEAAFPHMNGKVVINNIGPTIGCHTGPGTVALFFWGDERNA
ncbi:MAG: DegV family protein [Clostridia bacterium]|nr:DegV family protein [Clostridia bacterium]